LKHSGYFPQGVDTNYNNIKLKDLDDIMQPYEIEVEDNNLDEFE